MAEAIATLSLVTNVFQVVSFTAQVVELCRSTLEDGSPDPSIAQKTAHLETLLKSLKDHVHRFDPVCPDDDETNAAKVDRQDARNRLRNISKDLADKIEELHSEMAKITVLQSSSWPKRLRAMAKYKFRYEPKISLLMKHIDATRGQLDSEFLSRTCSSTQASHIRSMKEFSNLKDDVKKLINNWAEGARDLQDLVSTEAHSTRALIRTQAEHTRKKIDAKKAQQSLDETRKRILSTLWFPEMNERENMITDASMDTVDWILFDDLPNGEKRSFRRWLRSDESMFWISGKPGSGKSTLAKFLLKDHRTKDNLVAWKPSIQLLRFFFFEIGQNPLQTQLAGCLRTLLHQLLTARPDAFKGLLDKYPALINKASEHDWALRELTEVLLESLQSETLGICIFLDGLDEQHFDESNSILLELIQPLNNLPNVKICALSRAENTFRQYFEPYPKIRMQQLTLVAMQAYVRGCLDCHRGRLKIPPEQYEEFVERISEKSDGVYLWTALVLKSLVRGIRNGDTWTIIQSRIEEYAPGLNELYNGMLKRQNADELLYKEDASRLFWSTLFYLESAPLFGEFDAVLSILGGDQENRKLMRSIISTKGILTENDTERIVAAHEEWLFARSAGLIELSARGDEKDQGLLDLHVEFVHRSVREFLLGTEKGKEVLSYDGRPDKQKVLKLLDDIIERAYVFCSLSSGDSTKQPIRLEPTFRRLMSDMVALMQGLGIEATRILALHEPWMPPCGRNIILEQIITSLYTLCGMLTSRKAHTARLFDSLTPYQKADILWYNCFTFGLDTGPPLVQWKLKDDYPDSFPNAQAWNEGWPMLKKNQMACFRLLLEVGADPNITLAPLASSLVRKRPDLWHGRRGLSSYQLFIYGICTVLNHCSRLELSEVLIREVLAQIEDCLKIFHEHLASGRNDEMSFELGNIDTGYNMPWQLAFRVSDQWFLEKIRRAGNCQTWESMSALCSTFSHAKAVRLVGLYTKPKDAGYDRDWSPIQLREEEAEIARRIEIWFEYKLRDCLTLHWDDTMNWAVTELIHLARGRSDESQTENNEYLKRLKIQRARRIQEVIERLETEMERAEEEVAEVERAKKGEGREGRGPRRERAEKWLLARKRFENPARLGLTSLRG
ncbi:hypothetical protein NUW58_g3726 [Xylaria curta]|uniref:Uncharacterized protein n=1 Tax=Xylaria curta TaxID=42375 RepID=A0ACC1PBB1_9PEZI|nr:hypothetical protein NUW58_g3726 [Xylaria curta]